MAITIETITVTRPMKVIAFTCCFITTFFMVACCATTDWVMAEGWREGLWEQCVDDGAPTPLPFGQKPVPGCHRAHDAGYIKVTAGLIIVVCFTDFFGTLLTGLGLRSTDPNKKYKYYRVAIYSLVIACIFLLVALIYYPVSFSKELKGGKRRVWTFGFGYGASWAAFILMFMSLVLLICDRESEEIFYKEKEVDDEEEEEEA
ncbi:hypothetical protein TCAL_06589 [Tigriopus californicus]|uniref:MARVEL domain-containing protein n=1 Tax=Tigriopus californicus TaxID=6832 RepID=A0A553PPN8_TIGCA|nr:hypothetical protein TCAL_06589 [Tigriopus californicus]|eukprot:TCALIF_06589-PA protein Name:"Protein of unknown function" AED:0.13 eAED:0.13 QI:360/0.8/1/1/0.8/0.66/6/1281/202